MFLPVYSLTLSFTKKEKNPHFVEFWKTLQKIISIITTPNFSKPGMRIDDITNGQDYVEMKTANQSLYIVLLENDSLGGILAWPTIRQARNNGP